MPADKKRVGFNDKGRLVGNDLARLKRMVQQYSPVPAETSPLTTKGDLYTFDSGFQRLPVGTDGQVLTADSSEATGVKWIDATGGSGVFITKSYSGHLTVAIGNSGDLITLTPPSGQKVRLVNLSTQSGIENGVTVTIGGSTVVNSLTLEDSNTGAGDFAVGINGTSNTAGSGGLILEITGDEDEVLKIIKDSGTNTSIIVYSYAYGI